MFAGELCHEEGLAGVELRGGREGLWPFVLEPGHLGARRLRGQGVARALEDGGLAELVVEPLDLCACTRVDAVEDAGTERGDLVVDGQDAGPDAAAPDSLDVSRGDSAPAEDLVDHRAEVAPPVGVGIVLGPARVGDPQGIGRGRPRQHQAVAVDEHRLGLGGPDIDTDEHGAYSVRRSAVTTSISSAVRSRSLGFSNTPSTLK